jgi:hypothetical protein
MLFDSTGSALAISIMRPAPFSASRANIWRMCTPIIIAILATMSIIQTRRKAAFCHHITGFFGRDQAKEKHHSSVYLR